MMTADQLRAKAKRLVVGSSSILCLLLGAAISLQPELTALALAAMAALVFFFMFPRRALILFLLASFFIPSYTKIDATAIFIIFSAGVSFLLHKKSPVLRDKSILLPLLVIALIVTASTLAGLTFEKNKIENIYRDGRPFFYWLILIPLAAWTPKDNSVRWLADRMMQIGLVVCVLAVIQGLAGKRLVDTGLVADLDTMSTHSMSTVRVQIPGFMFAMFAITYVTSMMLGRVRYVRPWRLGFKVINLRVPLIAVWAALALGIIFNFGRALWFWTAVSLLIAAAQYGYRGFGRFLAWVAVPAVLGLAALAVVKPDMLETIGTRITSVADEGGVGSSFGWRELEMQEGRKALESTALLGVGMGGQYRRFNMMLANFPDHTIYTHNGWLYLTLKLSIFGFLAYLWLGWRVVRSIATAPKRNDTERAIGISCVAFSLAFLGINFTQPEIMSHYGLLTFVFICAMAFFFRKQARDGLAGDMVDDPESRAFQDTIPSQLALA
ncbi:O-antigen ligase family protein [Aquabacterium sp.]|uniref:O-antigen ligase family protein n=1 Tax=Aquabacterium sp. TaxID=1872578 RepID=UPI0035B469DF